MMNKLYFGPSGLPLSTPQGGIASGLAQIHRLGLSAMEIGWVHGARTNDQDCAIIKKTKEQFGLGLTAHGSYYINLNAVEPDKRLASRARVIEAVKKSYLAGVEKMVFHAAFYLEQPREVVLNTVIQELRLINQLLSLEEQAKVIISIETTGKDTQFGSLEEVIAVAQEFQNIRPCIDFSHLFARSLGQMNGYDFFCQTLELLGQKLGRDYLNNMHIHLSGIEYGPKGEKKHVLFSETTLDYRGLLQSIKKFQVGGHLVVESPTVETEALYIQDLYHSLP